MPSAARIAALLLAATGLFITTEAFAGDNWARDLVHEREAAVFARAGGPAIKAGRPSVKADSEASDSDIRPMIVGGIPSPPNRWPFQVGLLLASVNNNVQAQFCGGSIIDEEFILTAAHCAEIVRARDLHVLTGTQTLNVGGTRHEVKRIKIHPRFDNATFDFDVALIQLKTKVTGLRLGQMASMATRDQERRMAGMGTNSFVVGWGYTGTTFPVVLREVSIPIVSRIRCNSEESYDGAVTPHMICAGLHRGGKDSCQGDSGGPLVVKDRLNRLRKQVGIVSWGVGCALPNFYGVYSRVATLEDWVNAAMGAMRASAASALACEISGGSTSSPACRRAAKDEAEKEITAYLDAIKRKGTRAQVQDVSAAQLSWSQSLTGTCTFDAAIKGQPTREECLAFQTRQRADALAEQVSALGD